VGTSEGELIVFTKDHERKANMDKKEAFKERLEKERTVIKYRYPGDEVFE